MTTEFRFQCIDLLGDEEQQLSENLGEDLTVKAKSVDAY